MIFSLFPLLTNKEFVVHRPLVAVVNNTAAKEEVSADEFRDGLQFVSVVKPYVNGESVELPNLEINSEL